MTTTPKKPQDFKRKKARQLKVVSFEVPGWDGQLELPAQGQLPVGLIAALTNEDDDAMSRLVKFLEKNAPDYAHLFDEREGDYLDLEDLGEIMPAWAAADGTDLGKSEA
jgi:hypothetical protein